MHANGTIDLGLLGLEVWDEGFASVVVLLAHNLHQPTFQTQEGRMNQPGSAYLPPDGGQIAQAQNSPAALKLLLAQRRLYSKAKRWTSLRTLGICGIAVAAPIVTAVIPKAAVVLGAVAALWIFLARTVFFTAERRYAAKGAEVQENFDLLAFGMPQLAARDPRVTPEEISDLVGSDQEAEQAATAEHLRDWYPIPADIRGAEVIAIAQRANVAYSERLLHTNANVWLTVTILWSVIAVALGLGLNLDAEQLLLGVLIPLLPALLDVWEQWRVITSAGKERRALADRIANMVRRSEGQQVTGEDLLVWQNQIYTFRRNSPLVPNLLYKRLRNRNELAMNAAASELADAAKEYQ